MTHASSVDVIVLGSGAAGLVAALAAVDSGASVGLFEKSGAVGGTTAISGGTCWVPNHGRSPDTRDDALTYLASLSHGLIRSEMAEALVDNGRLAVEFIERTTDLRFGVVQGFPDYHAEHPGGRPHGSRSLDPGLFSYASLGAWAHRVVRPPRDPYMTLPETTMGGGTGRIERAVRDMRCAEDLRGCGAALVGGLLKALLDRGVAPELEHRARSLATEDGKVIGVLFDAPGGLTTVAARAGVVIATGGFEWNDALVRSFLRGPMTSPASYPSNTGDGLVMAMAAGAQLGMMREAWWAPTIEIPGDEQFGSRRAQIVLRERTLPRSIIVNRAGRRFTNEAANYNAFGSALHEFAPSEFVYPNLPCWLIFDHTYWDEYGFADFRGDTPPEWINAAPSLAELAARIGAHTSLADTVLRWNHQVASGRDLDFGRGEGAYDGWNGDPKHRGTSAATLGPITDPPFYAIQLNSGCIGTRGGPMTDPYGGVLDHDQHPIRGLYAAGNAMASPTGMVYGGAGGTLGQAITFGFLAGTSAAAARLGAT